MVPMVKRLESAAVADPARSMTSHSCVVDQKALRKSTEPPKERSMVAPGVMVRAPPVRLTASKVVPRLPVVLSVSSQKRVEESA